MTNIWNPTVYSIYYKFSELSFRPRTRSLIALVPLIIAKLGLAAPLGRRLPLGRPPLGMVPIPLADEGLEELLNFRVEPHRTETNKIRRSHQLK